MYVAKKMYYLDLVSSKAKVVFVHYLFEEDQFALVGLKFLLVPACLSLMLEHRTEVVHLCLR